MKKSTDAKDRRPLPFPPMPELEPAFLNNPPGGVLISGKYVQPHVGDVFAAGAYPPLPFNPIREDIARMATIPVDRIAVEKARGVYRGVVDSGGRPYLFALSGVVGLLLKEVDGDRADKAWATFDRISEVERRFAVEAARAADGFCKSIETGQDVCFAFLPLPPRVRRRLARVQRKLFPDAADREEVDHITLVYAKPGSVTWEPGKEAETAVNLGAALSSWSPLAASAQGWAYFDGATKDGVGHTAVVALIDAPRLDDLAAVVRKHLRADGHAVSSKHVFVPHVTLGYLPKPGMRLKMKLPALDVRWKIRSVRFVGTQVHRVPLPVEEYVTGSVAKALPKKAKPKAEKKAKTTPKKSKTGGAAGQRGRYPSDEKVAARAARNLVAPSNPDPAAFAAQIGIGQNVLHGVVRRFADKPELKGKEGFVAFAATRLRRFSHKHGVGRDTWGKLYDVLAASPDAPAS